MVRVLIYQSCILLRHSTTIRVLCEVFVALLRLIVSYDNIYLKTDERRRTVMLSRNSTIIDPQKGKEFSEFLRKNAKSQEFWNDVKKKK